MATPEVQEVPQVDPAESRSAFDHVKAAPPATPSDADNAAAEDMFKAAEEVFKAQPQRATTEPDKATETTKAADAPEPTDRKLPPPIKAKPDAPPKEDKFDDLENLPPEKWPRNAQQWKEYKSKFEAQVKHYETELAKWKDRAKSGGPEVQDIIKERDVLRDELRSIAVERDPQFQQKYNTAFTAVRDNLESVLSKDDVDKALALFEQKPGVRRTEALEKFTEGLSPIKQSAITSALLDHDKTVRMRDAEVGEARKNWDKMQLESRVGAETRERETAQKFEKAFESVVKEWTDEKEGYEFMRRTGDAKSDKPIDETVELARSILSGQNTPDEMARAAMYAAMSPRIMEAYVEAQNTIAKLEKQIKSLKSASPSLDSGQSTGTGGDAPGDDTAYGDAIAKIALQAGLPLR